MKISDEGGYWPGRNLKALRRSLDEMNRAVAAAAGLGVRWYQARFDESTDDAQVEADELELRVARGHDEHAHRLAEGRIGRALIVDLDVHQGNGTAAIFAADPAVYTLSLHGERNYPVRKERSSRDVELADGVWVDEHTLRATIPAGLPVGQHALTVENALGGRGQLQAAYEVVVAPAFVIPLYLSDT